MGFLPKRWGEYPPEYNREIHGPYNPSVYYGKRDTPFTQVKLGDLGAWLGRRNKSPGAILQAISRAYFRYNLTWMAVKKPGPTFLYHILATAAVISYFYDYTRFSAEKRYRYH